ncbi:MAG: hypothetical protein IPL84_00375 [Chitinophagaceae bacterium]|nr:hypothetical protein [Chitinophagaceae bacterium]
MRKFLNSGTFLCKLISGVFILLKYRFPGAALIFHEDIDRMQSPAIPNQGDTAVHINKLYTLDKAALPGCARSTIASCQMPSAGCFSIYDVSYRWQSCHAGIC